MSKQGLILEDKKAKSTIKFGNYKIFLEPTQIETKLNHLEKNKIDADSLKKKKKNQKKYKLIIKPQQRFRGERHNVFTEEFNKTALGSNHDRRIQSIDSIETYAYGTNKDLMCKKEEIKCSNIRKQYKNN